MRGVLVQSSLGVIFRTWNILFSRSKDSDANFRIIANVVEFVKETQLTTTMKIIRGHGIIYDCHLTLTFVKCA